MPLNVNEPPSPLRDAEGRPQPILSYPSDEAASRRKIILTIFLLVVIGAAIFLLYVFVYMNAGRPAQETSPVPVQQPAAPAEQKPAAPPVAAAPPVRQLPGPLTGRYTIYIASYIDKADADAEIARWKAAGFDAFDVHAVGHYRVALGQYAAVGEAQRTAEKWKEAFENGYWIGKLE